MIHPGSTRREFEACDHCQEPFEVGARYPVAVREDGGSIELYSFCDETCKRAWETEVLERH